MITVHDTASYIFQLHGAMSVSKMHSLLYYVQGWSYDWLERPMFDGSLCADITGPVFSEVAEACDGVVIIRNYPLGKADSLDDQTRGVVGCVVKSCELLTGAELRSKVCSADFWQQTRDDGASIFSEDAVPVDPDSIQRWFGDDAVCRGINESVWSYWSNQLASAQR